ncbi:cysteine desulfurase [Candidatus Microgenomates bacterium]|nr:cysteine desulfurase [Candidatus Microgenomates bacterium]
MKKVYLDYAATTPLDPRVLRAMMSYMTEKFGNPSSIHSWGREARMAVEESRKKMAKILNCQPEEIIFTGTTTTGDNLAIQGIARAAQKKDQGNHIITSSIEHHGVLDTCKALEKQGFQVTYLPVNKDGMVDVKDIEKTITEKTVLITIMYANNEVGTIQPIEEIARWLHGYMVKAKRRVYFHTDAAAAVDYLDIDVQKLGIDLMTIGAHKFGGPKGIGALYIRKGTEIEPLTYGGHHEKGLWPGTEAVPLIVGMAKALEIADQEKKQAVKKVSKLRDKLIKGLLAKISDSQLTGHPTNRLPDMASFVIKRVEGEAMLLHLSDQGIAASSGSACTSGVLEPSHVLTAMGISPELAHGSLRFSLGKKTTDEEIDYALSVLPRVVERLRKIAPKLS